MDGNGADGKILIDQSERRCRADRILYEKGLLSYLETIGEPHIIGSYRMDMMAWNDLDIDILNDQMDRNRLYQLTSYILETFQPLWYEAKEEVNDEGKTVWFHGFHTVIDGEMWNLDLWFFDLETIEKAERYCDEIAEKVKRTPGSREAVIKMKQDLISRGLYGFYQYSSMDVYRAVLEQNIYNMEDLLTKYKRGVNKL